MIEARQLSKWFGQVMALNDVSVRIGAGVTGLLGPNGAGKTTFLRLVTGQLRPSQGELLVDGQAVWNNPALMRRIGFCPEEDAFYLGMSGLAFVTALARLSGLGRREGARRAEATMERVGMRGAQHRRVGGYSRGMRQRTKLAQALVHDPQLLILDEPLTGTDPVGRRELRELIAGLAGEGKQVVISSHVLHEVESLTSTITLIHGGRVVASGEVEEIRALLEDVPHRIVIRSDRARELGRRLVAQEHVVGLELEGERLVVQTRQPNAFYAAFPELVLASRAEVEALYAEDDNLGAVFSYLVARR